MHFHFIFVLLLLVFPGSVWARAIRITTVSGLSFGTTSAPGDAARTVSPGTSETAANASFSVNGDVNRAYTITLPASGSLTTGAGGANRTIAISTFLSFPAQGANGNCGPSGTQLLFVGATMAALPVTQLAGAYTGTMAVTVVY